MTRTELPAEPNRSPDAEQRATDLANEYLDRLQSGQAPDRQALLAAHPDIAALLDEHLRVTELLHGVAHGSPAAPAVAGPARPRPAPANGPVERLGRYVVGKVLGHGQSATVYRAYDPKFQRAVALKVLRRDQLDATDTDHRFARDARIAAQLRHPHIVPLHEAGEGDGYCYLDMELVRGESLAARLQRGRVSFAEAATLVQKIALALDYSHGRGIIHRDVKPSNILLDKSGEPQLTDFGLARRDHGEPSLTCEGQILGTPQYMPPEQAQGGSRHADARSDVYSLGVVFYQLLTGQVPFACDDAFAHLYHSVHSEPAAPRVLDSAVPRDLETICVKALAKEPAERFASAADFAEELGRWLRDEPLRIRPPTPWERLRRWLRRNRPLAGLAAAAAALLLGVALVLGSLTWSAYRRAYESQVRADLEAQNGQVRETLLADVEAQKAELEVRSLLQEARQRLRSPEQGRRQQVQTLLAQIAAPRRKLAAGAVQDRLDQEARSVYVQTLGVPDLRMFACAQREQHGLAAWPAALHPDGELMALGTERKPLRWLCGQPLEFPSGRNRVGPPPCLSFSPDGAYLVFAPGTGGLELWDGGVRELLRELEPASASPVRALGFDRAAKTVWACHADGRVVSWSLLGGEQGVPWRTLATMTAVTTARFDAEARRLAVADAAHRVILYQGGGKVLVELPPTRAAVEALAWSPDSRFLAVGTKDGRIQLWNLDRAHPELYQTLAAFDAGVTSLLFSLDGHWLLAGQHQSPLKVWDVATGELLLVSSSVAKVPWAIAHDGRRLALTCESAATFCELGPSHELRRLSGHRAGIAQLAWSRNQRHLASLDNRFEIRTWDTLQGVAVDAFQGPEGGFWAANAAVALSDDGRYVAFASGGPDAAAVLVRDVEVHATLGTWTLPGGFERLAFSEGRFLLVREENDLARSGNDPHAWPARTVVYELHADRPPRLLRELRPSGAGDRWRFIQAQLTADGRFYSWLGPRDRPQARRLELYEVATGRQLLRWPYPSANLMPETYHFLDPAGRSVRVRFWPNRNQMHHLVDGTLTELPALTPLPRAASSAAHLWAVDDAATLFLYRSLDGPPYLVFESGDLGPVTAPCFNDDGRYLAWGNLSGTVSVADLHVLAEKVQAFERALDHD